MQPLPQELPEGVERLWPFCSELVFTPAQAGSGAEAIKTTLVWGPADCCSTAVLVTGAGKGASWLDGPGPRAGPDAGPKLEGAMTGSGDFDGTSSLLVPKIGKSTCGDPPADSMKFTARFLDRDNLRHDLMAFSRHTCVYNRCILSCFLSCFLLWHHVNACKAWACKVFPLGKSACKTRRSSGTAHCHL